MHAWIYATAKNQDRRMQIKMLNIVRSFQSMVGCMSRLCLGFLFQGPQRISR